VTLGAICYLINAYMLQVIPSDKPVTMEIHNTEGWVLHDGWPTIGNQKYAAGTLITKAIIAEVEKTATKKWSVAPAHPFPYAMYIQYCVPLLVFVIGAYFVFILVNKERFADFLIATESEMKKVSWSSREELIGSTAVVIATVVILAVIIWLADAAVISSMKALNVY